MAIESALTQTFSDIEILIGDDNRDGRLAELVGEFDDPRIQYIHHGFNDGGINNILALWERAQGSYIKPLFDDDFLTPTSVESLVAALQSNPDASMAFHERVFIDENNQIVEKPHQLLQPGHTARLDRAFLVKNMVCEVNNFVGEPSSVMFNPAHVKAHDLFSYRGIRPEFLFDVVMYLQAAEVAPVIAVGGYLSAFRRHSRQGSNEHSAIFSAGLFEWEMLLRGEAAAGNLDAAALEQARQRLTVWYASKWFVRRIGIPEIARFAANLDELVQRPAEQLFESEQFTADLTHGYKAIAARVAARKNNSHMAQKYCALCESPVQDWNLHPAGQDLMSTMQVGSAGPTLDKSLCPNCSCSDRERHLWLYMKETNLLGDLSRKRVLHIAPEAGVERKIRAGSPLEYVAGDMAPKNPEHRALTVEKLDFPDGYFDLILCNHVLERLANPDKAIAEMARCLSANGYLVAQTPYSPILRQTFELTIPINEQFAAYCFGQNDRVRLFGVDIVKRFEAAGLHGDLYPHASVLGELSGEVIGCNESEPFFLFSKNPHPLVFAD
jgi:SAM-dependent methyltransferase